MKKINFINIPRHYPTTLQRFYNNPTNCCSWVSRSDSQSLRVWKIEIPVSFLNSRDFKNFLAVINQSYRAFQRNPWVYSFYSQSPSFLRDTEFLRPFGTNGRKSVSINFFLCQRCATSFGHFFCRFRHLAV